MRTANDELNSLANMMQNALADKVAEVNSVLVDAAESIGVHILVNITIVDNDQYMRTIGISSGFPSKQLMYATLGQSENVYSSLQ